MTRADDALNVQVGDQHRRRAVRDQPDQRHQHFAQHRDVDDDALEEVFSERLEDDIDRERDREDQHDHLQGMLERGDPDILLTLAVLLLAEVVDMLAARRLLALDDAQNDVDDKARDDSADHLEQQDLDDLTDVDLLRNQDRQHFVAGGQEYRQQGAEGHDSGGVEACDRAGKAALRHRAEDSAESGSGNADLGDNAVDLLPRALLDEFHQKVRKEQDRQHQRTILQAVKQTIQY